MTGNRLSIPNVNKHQRSPDDSQQLLRFQSYCSVIEAKKKPVHSADTAPNLVKKVGWLRLKIAKERNPRKRDSLIAQQNKYLAMIMTIDT